MLIGKSWYDAVGLSKNRYKPLGLMILLQRLSEGNRWRDGKVGARNLTRMPTQREDVLSHINPIKDRAGQKQHLVLCQS